MSALLRVFVLGLFFALGGCGGTSVKDYNENVPIPDVPPSGGGGLADDEEAMEAESAASSVSEDTGSATTPQARQRQRGTEAAPSPTKSEVFD